jgi:quercetin dioxygenase-like cupin family protein
MAFIGQILDNPVSGERFIFSQTAADTGGELLAVEFVVAPDGHVPGGHVHPVQEERFEVVSGRMRFKKGRKTVLAGPGDTLVVPPGTYHRFANDSEGPAVIRVEVRPALKMEQLWETTVALAAEGRTFGSGLPWPLDLALFMREFEQEVRAPFAPGLVRAATAPLAWLAVRRGLARRYQAPGIQVGAGARRPAPSRPGERRDRATRPVPARPVTPRKIAGRVAGGGRPHTESQPKSQPVEET